MVRAKWIFLLSFVGMSWVAATQESSDRNYTLSGKVIDGSNQETLPYATVAVKGASLGTTTNADGFFTLMDIPQDTGKIIIQYLGYQSRELSLRAALQADPLVIELSETQQMLEEVVVRGSNLSNQIIDATESISQIGLSPKAIQSLPSMGEQDIFRALQLLPGVSGANEASSGLYVRGGTPDQNLILLDGFTVYHVDHFYGFFSAFNPNAIKDVQLYKGGFGAKYGGRLSSVMELTGKTGNQSEFSGGGSIGAISANAYLEIPISEKLNVFLAGRRSYTDIIQSGIYNDIFDLYNDSSDDQGLSENLPERGNQQFQQQATEPSFYFYDLNAKLSYRPTSKDVISLSFYNGRDKLDNSRNTTNSFEDAEGNPVNIDNDVNDLLEWGNFGASLRWARQWGDRLYSNAVISYSNYFSDRDRLSEVGVARPDTTINRTLGNVETNDLYDLNFTFNNTFKLNRQHELTFGLQNTYNDIDYQFVLNDTLNLIDENNEGLLTALYLQDAWQLTPRASLTGGMRASYYDVTGEMYYEPRLSASYDLTSRIKLQGAWGRYYQFVNRIVREDVTQGSRDFWLLADDESSPVSFSRQWIGGLSYETPDWLLNVEYFDKSLEGISEFSLRFQNIPGSGAGEEQYFFEGTGVARGMELLLQKKMGALKGWISYTLSEVVHDIPGISDDPFYALHDSRHEINLVTTYEWRRWDFGATWVYGAGQPYTAPYGEYEITTLDGTTYQYINVGAKNAFRLPDYHRLDLSATYNFNLGSGEGSLGLSIFNAYGRSNIWYKEFLVEEDEIVETDVELIGFTPNLNFRVEF